MYMPINPLTSESKMDYRQISPLGKTPSLTVSSKKMMLLHDIRGLETISDLLMENPPIPQY